MKPRLFLHCDADQSRFVLNRQGENRRHQFTALRQALDFAGTIISEDTALTIHNPAGRVMMETIVSPASAPDRNLPVTK